MMTLSLMLASLAAAPPPLTTLAETSGWKETGRYEEVVALCERGPKAFPGRLRCERFGTTPEGRPMLAFIASDDGTLSAEKAAERGRPVVLFHGGIHAGEIDGKDAGFWLLRDLLEGKVAEGALSKVTAVFIPVLNVDGHERFGTNNRPNQAGPAAMGWRVTADNLNLNRDFTKAEAAETRALLALLDAWDPIVYLDLHVTDGAQFEHDVAVIFEPQESGPLALRALGKRLRQSLFQKLERQGHLPLPFYPSLIREEDPTSGFRLGIAPPRFSSAYWALRNRFGVLVETHSWKPYAHRVKTTYDVVAGFLELAREDAEGWVKAAKQADAADASKAARELPLVWKHGEKATPLAFRGVAYRFETSPVSGERIVRYEPETKAIWEVPYFATPVPKLSVSLPGEGGYLVPPAHVAWVKAKLQTHGLRFTLLPTSRAASVEAFRATATSFSSASYEGRQRLEVTGSWSRESRELPGGTLFVPLAQPGRELVAHLFEPAAPDSFLAWGFFNAHFEQKEYIEDYVLEPWAAELLAKDPEVKAAFEAKLKDPAFAKDPRARMRFFYERHPSYDAALNLYPVLRARTAP